VACCLTQWCINSFIFYFQNSDGHITFADWVVIVKFTIQKASSDTQGLLVGTMPYFRAKVYFQSRQAPWALILTEPVPEVFEFRPADGPEKYFINFKN